MIAAGWRATSSRCPVTASKGKRCSAPAMCACRRLPDISDLTAACNHARDQLARLPEPLARLEPFHYAAEIGAPLRELAAQLDRQTGIGGTAA